MTIQLDKVGWAGQGSNALLLATLFGARTSLAKLLLSDGIKPWMLSGLLYLESGFGFSAII